MSSASRSPLDRLRQPAYTGENRCVPCTVVNVAIAAVVSALVAVLSIVAGAVVLVASLLAIYVRGYLVPGTPTLTARYLPDTVLTRFGKDPEREPVDVEEFEVIQRLENERENGVVPREFVVNVGAVRAGEQRRLDPDFADAVSDRVADLAGDPIPQASIADLFDADADDVTALDREYPAYEVGIRVRKWPASLAFRTDVATHEALVAWDDRWVDVPLSQRVDMLQHLRSLWERCPACGGVIEQSGETFESCCYSAEVLILACRDCDERLLEADPESADLPQPTPMDSPVD